MKVTCGLCGQLFERGDKIPSGRIFTANAHRDCIVSTDARQLLTTLNTDELFTIRENLESRYMRLRGELDEINSCVWRCDNEIARRRASFRNVM